MIFSNIISLYYGKKRQNICYIIIFFFFFFSPHSDVSSSDGDLSADGIHRYHCECGRDEMHKGGWQQPIHQEQDRHLWRESVPALRWVSKPTQFNRFGESMYNRVFEWKHDHLSL